GEGSAIPTKPHHTPSPQEQHSPHHDPSSPSHPTTTTKPIPQTPTKTSTKTPTLRQYSRRATQIAQSKALSPVADEPASLLRDNRQREAFLTVSSLDAGQDKKNILKTSAFPYESSPRVTSLDADKGSMQQKLQELMDLCTSLQRQQAQMAAKIKDQDLEISGLKERVKFLKDNDRGSAKPTQEDAPIKGGIMETGEEVRADKSTKLGSNDNDEMVNVLSSMEAANILTSGVAAVSVSPVAAAITAGVPTVSAIFTTASVIDAQVAREMEEEFARENQRLSEQLARDYEIAKLHAKEELKMMIEGLDRSNEGIAKHLQEYDQAVVDLFIGENIELINELTKHFRGMTLEEFKEKFIPIWKQFEDFVPMFSKEESKRVKRQGSSKRMKTSKSVFEGVSEEELKEMMQLVPLEEVYVEALQTWVELKRLFEPDFEDQLWTHNQAFIHDPLEWKLYDTCGVHYVFTKDQEIFMLVEKDYPLRRGLATVMICNKLQPEFKRYGPKSCKRESKNASENIPNELKESTEIKDTFDVPLVKKLVSDDNLEKKIVVPIDTKIEFVKAKQQEKPVRKPVKHAEMYRSQGELQLPSKGKSVNTARPRPGTTARPVNTVRTRPVNTVRPRPVNNARPNSSVVNAIRANQVNDGNPQQMREDQGYVDSRCSRHMTGNMSYLLDFKEFNRGYVTFRGGANGGRITGKETIHTGNLDFEDVYFVKELKFNLLVSHRCKIGACSSRVS
nr:ribonuclease H-like domain-containing protein [Tanacetum cinerariifolium]